MAQTVEQIEAFEGQDSFDREAAAGVVPAAPLFPLGTIVLTPGAITALLTAKTTPAALVERHEAGDWGTIGADDAAESALSLAHGFRVMSVYELTTGTTVWIITEADRSVTTLLLPEEY
jgi:hypothetical protein